MTTPKSPNSRLYAAWFENLAVAEDHPDRVYFIVEATLRNAQMSAHHEVEESGPEVGLPAKRVMTSPVQAYVREDIAEAAAAVQGRELAWRVEAMNKHGSETTALRRERDALRVALRKVQTACQYTGTNPTLLCAADVKAIVEAALALTTAGKGVG